MNTDTKESLSKVPEVTLAFWIIKIAATTLGEIGGDAVTMGEKASDAVAAGKDAADAAISSSGLGYLAGMGIFGAIFILPHRAAKRAH